MPSFRLHAECGKLPSTAEHCISGEDCESFETFFLDLGESARAARQSCAGGSSEGATEGLCLSLDVCSVANSKNSSKSSQKAETDRNLETIANRIHWHASRSQRVAEYLC
jgi:hypothetical protein